MSRPRPDRRTLLWWAVGVVGIGAAVAWCVWYVMATQDAVRPTVTGYAVVSDSEVRVEYDLDRPADTAVRCVVIGLDARHGRVGTATDDIPAAGGSPVHRTVTVRTTARAVTGIVDSCTRVTAGGSTP